MADKEKEVSCLKLPVKEILDSINTHRYASDTISSDLHIENKDLSVFFLCLLYHNKLITKKQLTVYCNRYNDEVEIKNYQGSVFRTHYLTRRINTYHSNITDKWYNDCTFPFILHDAVMCKCTDLNMTISDFLLYLNHGFSRNRNWCVDYLAYSIIRPITSIYDEHLKFKVLAAFNIGIDYISYEEADRLYDLGTGYCCSDCDGCYGEYKRARYRWHYKKDDTEKTRQKFVTEFWKLKTHNKNPNDKLYDF